MTTRTDLNMLVALDALLETSSVTAAAERLHTSAPAMSRTLGRLRRHFGDPLLVRAGRRLVPTEQAVRLRPRVRALMETAGALLADGAGADPASWRHTVTVQMSDVLTADLVPGLLTVMRAEAPGVRLRLAADHTEGTAALRDGLIDLEVGAIDHTDPETLTESLGTLTPALAVRPDHPLTRGDLTAERIAAAGHIGVSRKGLAAGPLDEHLAGLGLRRDVVMVVPAHAPALLLAASTDLVCLVPDRQRDAAGRAGLRVLPLPFALPATTIGMAWHPRTDTDPVRRWLRGHVRTAARALL
ncbi:LysR family transcriptional regulator [Actinoplanes utahensis]|uniref:LysR family transcriptional regulator n=1 Tax=Actinoplanes utahensis TaxID=1869 RepID=UPI000AC8D20C|nr:LysR family transcriptional regulator [Actinoplanes utahensis]GIF32331.1 hypothetical protein Aut01nite_53170 [Actinoplanes utahensis]